MIELTQGSDVSGCCGSHHCWEFAGDRPEGFSFHGWPCRCGAKIWVDETCASCGHKSGKMVDASEYKKREFFGTNIEELLDFLAFGERK